MKVLMIGDVYSSVGRRMIANYLPKIQREEQIDLTIVNGENISHGKGINKEHYDFLKNFNVDVITSGNHIFKQRETADFIDNTEDLLKPANINSYTPGNGTIFLNINNQNIRVTCLMGRTYMDPCDNPYEIMDSILELKKADIHIVDFHAEATAEKMAFAHKYKNDIQTLVGTHTHVQTADEQIIDNKIAYITDLGMTGCYQSVIGVNIEDVIKKESTGLPTKFDPASGKGQICGVIITFQGNLPKSIKRIFIKE